MRDEDIKRLERAAIDGDTDALIKLGVDAIRRRDDGLYILVDSCFHAWTIWTIPEVSQVFRDAEATFKSHIRGTDDLAFSILCLIDSMTYFSWSKRLISDIRFAIRTKQPAIYNFAREREEAEGDSDE